jgi:hypothetical protein
MGSLGLVMVLILVLLVSGRMNKKQEKVAEVPVVLWERKEVSVVKATSRFISKSAGPKWFDRLLQNRRDDIRSRFLDWSDNCKECDRLYQDNLRARQYAIS